MTIRKTNNEIRWSLFFYFSHGVRLSPLCTAATVWSVVSTTDDI
jgi:hypothetical protein